MTFPASPVDGQQITLSNGVTYEYSASLVAWFVVPGPAPGDFMSDGSVAMSGSLDVGGNAIVNAPTVNGADMAVIAGHPSNTSNPHAVTAAQVGAYPTASVDSLIAAVPTGDFKANGSVPMTGDLDAGGNAIVNASTVNGVDIAAIGSISTDPEFTGFAKFTNATDDATYQKVIEMLRGDGTGSGITIESKGDGANGVDYMAIFDKTSGDKLLEIGSDGKVDALSGFKANGIVLPRILGVYFEEPVWSVTRTGATWYYYYEFATIPRKSATSKLLADMICRVSAGDASSNFGAGYVSLAYKDSGGSDNDARIGLSGTRNYSTNYVTVDHAEVPIKSLLDNTMQNASDEWEIAIGTACATSGVDATWANPVLSAIEIEGGDIG